MANTLFNKLSNIVRGAGNISPTLIGKTNVDYSVNLKGSDPLYTFTSKEARDEKLLQLKQQRLLSHQWAVTNKDISLHNSAAGNAVMMMYRDADYMDMWPEIGSALDIYAEESTFANKEGKILNIHSKSDRVKAILEDLFVNRLDIHITLPMIARSMCKYGNEFMLLNIDGEKGVIGYKELPVHEMQRVEAGMNGVYNAGFSINTDDMKDGDVCFVWNGHNDGQGFRNWQMAHFRLIKDSLYLPYGVSILNKARRHWRILSMMEDAMLLYRLERSIERRIFKVNVGLIDDVDVPQFLQEFMTNVKRAPVIDPMTGMMDLRKNFLDVTADYVIPVRSGQDPTSIETLQAAQSQTSMDDIEYVQRKILAALRVPRTYLNFDEPQGKGQNLAIMDIRFSRAVNSVQQAMIMELTRIAIIHLYLLGFTDDITNFSLSMNNPSNQIEEMELDNQSKRLQNASSALAEQGGGIPLMSWHRVQKEIMGLSDSEISDMLNEIRLEAAIANEIQMTNQIIKRTGVFRKADNIYGEPGAEYQDNGGQGDEGPGGGFGGGGGFPGGGGFGDGMDDLGDDLGGIGEPGGDGADIPGDEGMADMGAEGGALMETKSRLMELINEYENLIGMKSVKKENATTRASLIDKAFVINEEINSSINALKENDLQKILEE